ncbi:MAG: hypothetical protein V5A37_05500, partial [Halobacteriales archaeon]
MADDRAVSEVIGAVLVFALLVTTLSIYQVMAIPGQNASVEYKHSQAVVDDFEAFGAAALGAAETGQPTRVAVTTGRQYPDRMLFVNPPAPAGTLSTATVGTGTVRLANATAVDGDAADFLDGDPVTYGTKALVYEPGYHEYAEAPTPVYSTGVEANHFAD